MRVDYVKLEKISRDFHSVLTATLKTKQIINNNFHRKQLKTFGILLFTFRFRFHFVLHSEFKKFGNCCNYVTLWVAVVRACDVPLLCYTATNKNATLFSVVYKLTIKVHDINFYSLLEKNCVLAQMENFSTCVECPRLCCVAMTQSITWEVNVNGRDVFVSSKIYGISIYYSHEWWTSSIGILLSSLSLCIRSR